MIRKCINSSLVALVGMLTASCAVQYPTYVDPDGENLATLTIRNVGEWYVNPITYAEPNGCTEQMWLGVGPEPGHPSVVRLKPNEMFSFQVGSTSMGVSSVGILTETTIKSCGGSMRFVPEENAEYEVTVGLFPDSNQCVFSVKQVTENGLVDIPNLVFNEVIQSAWATATSPRCEKFE